MAVDAWYAEIKDYDYSVDAFLISFGGLTCTLYQENVFGTR